MNDDLPFLGDECTIDGKVRAGLEHSLTLEILRSTRYGEQTFEGALLILSSIVSTRFSKDSPDYSTGVHSMQCLGLASIPFHDHDLTIYSWFGVNLSRQPRYILSHSLESLLAVTRHNTGIHSWTLTGQLA